MLQIVPATADDAAEILQLITGLAVYEKLAHEVVATEADLRRWLFGDRPMAEVILAREDGGTLGFALFFHNFSTFLGRPGLYLEDLFVVPESRNRGIGRALLARLAAIAVERGCGRLEWSVLDWNAPAVGFYERMGARVMTEWRICRLTGEALDRVASQA
jgi:GNAT superfamily N-acetyltransferase